MFAKFRRGQPGRRRSRRMTGAPLNYYRSRSKGDFAASPFEKRRIKKIKFGSFFSKGFDVFLVCAIGAGLLYSLFVSPNAAVLTSSEVYHKTAVYQAAANRQLTNIKDRNKLTFDEASLIHNLQSIFPEIKQASVELPLFGQKPKIRLNISAPALFIDSRKQKYVVDNSGRAVALVTDLPHIHNLTVVEDQTGFTMSAGKQVLSSDSAGFINSLIAQCRLAKVPVAALILPPRAQEIDLRTSDRSYYVKFYLGGDPVLQSGQFLAARHNFDQTNHQPSEYLDVRVSGKVYFK